MVSWKSARRKQRRFAELTDQERWLLLQAVALLPLIAVGRRLVSYTMLKSTLGRVSRHQSQLSDTLLAHRDVAFQCTRMVQIAASHSLLQMNCLDRSLALWSLLRQHGLVAEIRFGVQKHGDQVWAHAWVEYQGMVLNDTDDVGDRFAPFPNWAE